MKETTTEWEDKIWSLLEINVNYKKKENLCGLNKRKEIKQLKYVMNLYKLNWFVGLNRYCLLYSWLGKEIWSCWMNK